MAQNEQVLEEVIDGRVPPATEAWMREVGRDCGWIREDE